MRRLSFWDKVRIFWLALVDERTAFRTKAVLGCAVLYDMLPIDLVPDMIAFLGITDDVIITIIVLWICYQRTKEIRREIHMRMPLR